MAYLFNYGSTFVTDGLTSMYLVSGQAQVTNPFVVVEAWLQWVAAAPN